ncbi:hypothetical protein VCSRO79_2872 [Vibrio cholerae]|nr:putative monosaccharide biosynthesis protein [Vibrio cholerae]GHZ33127.1 hypothetical protein VCSRO79_2872 [Vibrio cholerae]
MIFIVKLFNKLFLYYTNMRRFFLKRLFLEIGSNVVFSPSDTFTFGTIKIGNDCYIGPGARFIASNSSITISDKVLFGPNVTIMGGIIILVLLASLCLMFQQSFLKMIPLL